MTAVASRADRSTGRLELVDVHKEFRLRGGRERTAVVVDGVTLTVEGGETVGLVGESGCGKSTLARCAVRLLPVTSGAVLFDGVDLQRLSPRALRPLRREIQMVFQDPYGSLNPRMRIGRIVGDAMRRSGASRSAVRERVGAMLERVGLDGSVQGRYPRELSGGQRQRVGIARALIVDPRILVFDEPVSALDVSIQAQVINLLQDLQDDLGLTYLFISHDLGVVRQVSTRVAVMYLGRIVELAETAALFAAPAHPYTEALLEAIPVPVPGGAGRRRVVLPGEVPDPSVRIRGCRFHPRCPAADDVCRAVDPPLESLPDGRRVACHHPRHVAGNGSGPTARPLPDVASERP